VLRGSFGSNPSFEFWLIWTVSFDGAGEGSAKAPALRPE
jgi:hypothetical protein